MNYIEILGYCGTAITSIILWPQAYKTIKYKDVEGLSLLSLILQLIGGIIFLIYSYFRDDLPIFFVQISLLASNITITAGYLKWKKKIKSETNSPTQPKIEIPDKINDDYNTESYSPF